jgi:hypothetical protein
MRHTPSNRRCVKQRRQKGNDDSRRHDLFCHRRQNFSQEFDGPQMTFLLVFSRSGEARAKPASRKAEDVSAAPGMRRSVYLTDRCAIPRRDRP